MQHLLRAILSLQFLLFLVSFSQHVNAQQSEHSSDVPRTLSYQAVLADANGVPLKDDDYTITTRLYSDCAGEHCVWQDSYQVHSSRGVIDLRLGSGTKPLPIEAMNGSLWVGIQINGSPEFKEYTELSAVPYALAVPNGSITAQKLGTDYVGSVSLNGHKVSGRGQNVNIVTGDGLSATADPSTNAILLKGVQPSIEGAKGGAIQGNTTITGTLTVTSTTSLNTASGQTNIGSNAFTVPGVINLQQGIVGGHQIILQPTSSSIASDATITFPSTTGTLVLQSRSISAGSGLADGGDLSANRTISLDLTSVNSWTGVQSLPASAAQGNNLIAAINLGNSGTINASELNASVTIQGNAFNAANDLVQLDASGHLPTVDGSALTNLTGANIGGTVANAVSFTGSLAGDVTGTQGLTTVAGLQGKPVSGTSPGTGQALVYNGTQWAPATIGGSGTVISADVSGGTTGLTTSGGPVTTSGTITLAGTLALTNGGTGASTASGARTNLNAATSGINDDITSLTGLTTAVLVGEGGTGLTSSGNAGNYLRSNGATWTSSAIQLGDLPNLTSSFIQNSTSLQSGANFNIGGSGTLNGISNSGSLLQSGNTIFSGVNVMSNGSSQSTLTISNSAAVDALYISSSSNNNSNGDWVSGVHSFATGSGSAPFHTVAVYGHSSIQDGTASGEPIGGRFEADGGIGIKVGVTGYASGASNQYHAGVYGSCSNLGSGASFGGMFQVPFGIGSGATIGLYSSAASFTTINPPTTGNYAAYFDGPTSINGQTSINGNGTANASGNTNGIGLIGHGGTSGYGVVGYAGTGEVINQPGSGGSFAGNNVGVYATGGFSGIYGEALFSGSYSGFFAGGLGLYVLGNETVNGNMSISGTLTTPGTINGTVQNALTLSGYSVGHGSGQIPLNDGSINSNLNAGMLGGNTASSFAPATNGTGYIRNQSSSAQSPGNFVISGSGLASSFLAGSFTPGSAAAIVGAVSSSNEFAGEFINASSSGVGILGIAGASSGSAIAGTGGSFNGNQFAVYGLNTSSSGTRSGAYFQAGSSYAYIAYTDGTNNWKILGNGSVSTIMPTHKGNKILYAPECPKPLFEDFGTGRLVNGRCHIELDSVFLDCIAIDSLHGLLVFPQLTGPCRNPIYVKKTATGFDLIEQNEEESNATFDYRIVACRKGSETLRFETAPPPPETKLISSLPK